MAAELSQILARCPEVNPQVVRVHLDRAGAEYLERFDAGAIAEHLRSLARLGPRHAAEILLRAGPDGTGECTVLAFDYSFLFSLVTGLLAGTGFSIDRGDAFTLHVPPPRDDQQESASDSTPRTRACRGGWRTGATSAERDPFRAAVVIDSFRGRRLDAHEPFPIWAERFHAAAGQVMGLLQQGDQAAVGKAKRLVNELVTRWLAEHPPDDARRYLYPVDLRIEPWQGRTRLTIHGPDAPAFLYTLATALALHGLSIERVRIGGRAERVEDQIDVADAQGRALTDPQATEQVRWSVLLTKQFAYFLDRAPDPFKALTRFEQLSEDLLALPQRGQWLEMLRNPQAMAELAKLLGTSDYLWEDFIRTQYESLLPALRPHLAGRPICPPRETIPQRLEEALAGATDLPGAGVLLNSFKDRELFLLDLEHILRAGSDFDELSRHLTLLAEVLLAAAAARVWQEQVAIYGRPRAADGAEAHYALFGLGKLGGMALGYASDVELLVLYDHEGQTQGGRGSPMANAEFFQRLAEGAAGLIKAKRDGVFQVDLRLRPYGSDGPLASSREQFERYYAAGGPAHPFERMALVRLRWIAGYAPLGFEVERARDRLLYDDPRLDLEALWDMWGKMRRHKRVAGRLDGKYSPGALADLEGAVELLQVRQAGAAPQLRTPVLLEAIEALRRAGVLGPAEFAQLVGAYRFFRRLINALRILRGSALDLVLPTADADELTHLARRMGYQTPAGGDAGAQLLAEFQTHCQAVREFVRRRFDRACPGEL
jgi:glutamate-ammonia-ligase adenylyltransferase